MNTKWRPPEAYVHGVDGPVVTVPARIAAWLDHRLQMARLRAEIRGRDSELDSVLVAMAVAAAAWRTSATGSADTPGPPIGSHSGWLTTSEAAQRLGVTDRAIRIAIATERLPAEKVGDRWQIAAEDVEHYMAARQTRRIS